MALKSRWQGHLAGVLTLGLAVSMIPFGAARGSGVEVPTPSAHYDMSHRGASLLDVSGNGRDAHLVDVEASDFASHDGITTLTFDGDGYATLPQGLVTPEDNDFAVEISLTAAKQQNQFAWVIGDGIGQWNTTQLGSHVFLNPAASGNERHQVFGGIRVKTGSGNGEVRILSGRTLEPDVVNTVTMVSRDDTIKLYLNGDEIASQTHPYTMSQIVPSGDVLGYLARSLYSPDPRFEGTLLDVKFWDEALDPEQIKASMPSDEERNAALDAIIEPKLLPALLGDNPSAQAISSNLTPPAVIDGVPLTWESSNPSVIGHDGVVTRPSDADTRVTMTATRTTGREYHYELLVLALNDQNALDADLDALDIPERAHEHLPLFVKGQQYGSDISWTSSDPAVVTPSNPDYVAPSVGLADPFADGGQISRPAYGDGDVPVTLTATATRGGLTASRTFQVIVEEQGRRAPDAGYAAAYFMGDSASPRADEKIYEAYTTGNDFFTFVEANDRQPVITSTTDKKGLRDPYILRSHDGDRYYMLATDLCIGCGQSWSEAQSQGSLKIMVWESQDLVHWTRTNASEDTGITVNRPEAGMTWAPEAYWDDDLQSYVVHFSSRLYDDASHTSIESYHSRIQMVLTRDFKTFTQPPVIWQDTGKSRIDSTVMKIGEFYYRFTKNEEGDGALGLERGKDIFLERSSVLTAPTHRSDWEADPSQTWQLIDTAMTTKVTGQAGEGPQVVRLNEGDPNNASGDGYVVLVDNYGSGGYKGFVTTGEAIADSSRSDRLSERADWKVYDPAVDGKSGLPERPRHGSFVNVPQQVLDAMAGWRAIEPVSSSITASQGAGRAVTVEVAAADQGQVVGNVKVTGAHTDLTIRLDDGRATFEVPEAETGALQLRYLGYRDNLVSPSNTSFTPEGNDDTVPQAAPIAEYSFAEAPADGRTVPNLAGGSPLGAAIVQNPDTAKFDDGSLLLPGGSKNSTGTWVRLPDDILKGATSATVQTEIKASEAMRNKYHFLWNVGNDANREYLFASLTCAGGRASAVGLLTDSAHDYFFRNGSCDFRADEWLSVTAVVDAETTPHQLRLHVNGVEVASGTIGDQSVAGVDDQSLNTIGRSPWPDELFAGAVANFRVWDEPLTADQIARISDEDAKLHADEIAASAAKRLAAFKVPTSVAADTLALPRDEDVRWTSSDPSVIDVDGTVRRPAAGEAAVTVTLTAIAKVRGQEATRDFAVTVEPELTSEAKARLDLDALAVHNQDNMRSNFSVPLVGDEGSTITWEVLDAGTTGAVLTDGVRDGAQTVELRRPAAGGEDSSIVLRARVRNGDVTLTKDIAITVPAIAQQEGEYEAYIWSFFTGEGDGAERVSLAASKGNDALAWNTLNDGQPIFSSSLGEEGLRDPFIIRSKDGDRFYLLATDLKMSARNNTDFAGAQTNGSLHLEIWESDDLVHWSQQRHVRVSPDVAGNTWAPEAYFDDEIGKYVVYWASNLHESADVADRRGPTYNRMLYAVTDDFVTFSEPQVWIDMRSDNQWGTIDVTVAKEDGVYYRFYKDEDKDMTVRLERSTDLLDTFVGDDSLPVPQPDTAKWSLIQEEIAAGLPNGAGGTFKSGEGPSIFPANPGDVNGYDWYLFIDQPNYHGGPNHYVPFGTTDALKDIDAESWDPLGAKLSANLPENADGGKPRHGTVIPVTRAEYERVLRAYQPSIAVASVEAVAVETKVGVAPALPDQLELTMVDGDTHLVDVVWEAVDAAAYAEAGTVTVRGTAQDDSRAPVEAEVTVTEGSTPKPEPTVGPSSEPTVGPSSEPTAGPSSSEPTVSPAPGAPTEPTPSASETPRPGLPRTGVGGPLGYSRLVASVEGSALAEQCRRWVTVSA